MRVEHALYCSNDARICSKLVYVHTVEYENEREECFYIRCDGKPWKLLFLKVCQYDVLLGGIRGVLQTINATLYENS